MPARAADYLDGDAGQVSRRRRMWCQVAVGVNSPVGTVQLSRVPRSSLKRNAWERHSVLGSSGLLGFSLPSGLTCAWEGLPAGRVGTQYNSVRSLEHTGLGPGQGRDWGRELVELHHWRSVL